MIEATSLFAIQYTTLTISISNLINDIKYLAEHGQVLQL